MNCKIDNIIHLEFNKKSNYSKTKYYITYNSNKYIALLINNNTHPIVYDECFDNFINVYNWYINSVGYAYSNNILMYMHKHISNLANFDMSDKLKSLDHINCYKLDNRISNLRIASQSEQNSNRNTRKDKLKPCEELINNGIIELPRYIRWDKTEKKFVIENHPILKEHVIIGTRAKASISGTKSKNLSIIDKYNDIIIKLNELNNSDKEYNILKRQFEENKIKLIKEYEIIMKTILDYNKN